VAEEETRCTVEERMRTVHILRSRPGAVPARSDEWVLLMLLLLAADTTMAALAWFFVGLFFE
jgi:hypothetical protein